MLSKELSEIKIDISYVVVIGSSIVTSPPKLPENLDVPEIFSYVPPVPPCKNSTASSVSFSRPFSLNSVD